MATIVRADNDRLYYSIRNDILDEDDDQRLLDDLKRDNVIVKYIMVLAIVNEDSRRAWVENISYFTRIGLLYLIF